MAPNDLGRAAAWAAPLFAHHSRQRVGLSLPSVLWLPDYGAYLRRADLYRCTFTTSPNRAGAMRLADDLALDMAQRLIDATGIRVQLRPYEPEH